MDLRPSSILRYLFDPQHGDHNRLIPRWLFLRALGAIYFSAFYSLLFQIHGLIGPNGILPAAEYLHAVHNSFGFARFWYAPTLLWFSASNHMLTSMICAGLLAAILLTINIFPRGMLLICFVCFLSFVAAASDFSGYQSDGMLLEAGFLSLFLAPPGFRPGLAPNRPPIRASVFLLLWEWFRIYFESGIAKIASGDPQWRHFTAMDEYYQNGPLPTWIGWYVQHLPHWFHAATAFGTLALELALVWMLFLPRRFRIICFFLVTPWQIGIILTANYTFLNYLVLALGIFLLDDRFLAPFVPQSWQAKLAQSTQVSAEAPASQEATAPDWQQAWARYLAAVRLALTAIMFLSLFYSSTVLLLLMIWPAVPFPYAPVAALQPFRVADRYGLFAVMTRGRYEIEFQGSNDGQNWVAYPFRHKPHLRTVSTPFRLESVVRLARPLALQSHRPPHRRAPPRRQPRRPSVIRRQSLSAAAAPSPRLTLAILVHPDASKTRARSVVAPSIARQLRPNPGARRKRPHRRHRMAAGASAPPMTSANKSLLPSLIVAFVAVVVGARFSASQSARTGRP